MKRRLSPTACGLRWPIGEKPLQGVMRRRNVSGIGMIDREIAVRPGQVSPLGDRRPRILDGVLRPASGEMREAHPDPHIEAERIER